MKIVESANITRGEKSLKKYFADAERLSTCHILKWYPWYSIEAVEMPVFPAC